MTELAKQCLQLPLSARADLMRVIAESIKREGDNAPTEDRANHLKSVMADILGVAEIPTKSRQWEFTWARNIIAYQLTNEGMSESETGRHLGKDHSTIVYARKRMRDALSYPTLYKEVIYIWKQFQNKLQNETTDKGTI